LQKPGISFKNGTQKMRKVHSQTWNYKLELILKLRHISGTQREEIAGHSQEKHTASKQTTKYII